MTYFVYLLRCKDHSLYCGVTSNLKRRLHEHNEGKKSAKYTRGRRPVALVYFEPHESMGSALSREAEIKSWPKNKKESIIKI